VITPYKRKQKKNHKGPNNQIPKDKNEKKNQFQERIRWKKKFKSIRVISINPRQAK
jgi:hypothetical protein